MLVTCGERKMMVMASGSLPSRPVRGDGEEQLGDTSPCWKTPLVWDHSSLSPVFRDPTLTPEVL